MRLLVDDQIFARQRFGGVSRYFVELMRAFGIHADLGVEVVSPRYLSINHYLNAAGLGVPFPSWRGRSEQFISLLNEMRAGGRECDILHHTYYRKPSWGSRRNHDSLNVVTVYDMIPEMHPELYPFGNPHRFKKRMVSSADLVLAISQATKDDLCSVWDVPSERVQVTHLGVMRPPRGPAPAPAGASNGLSPSPYVLFVGNRGGYKDFAVLVRAFAALQVPPQWRLIAAGGGPLTDDEVALLRGCGLAERTEQIDATDAELAGLYARAVAFAFPSRYEGFGLPTLEAMASGCPVVLSNSSAHPEVGGEVARYFAPGDSDDLGRVLSELIADPDERESRGRQGRLRAAEFSWEKAAAHTATAYSAALRTRS